LEEIVEMLEHLHRRILYGRQIQISAIRLIEMHGIGATAVARHAAGDRGLPEAERNYWAAVARRTARLSTCVAAPGDTAAQAPVLVAPRRSGGRAAAAFSPAAACEPLRS
jgi:hypothetical protein